jgi:hypothetical protein
MEETLIKKSPNEEIRLGRDHIRQYKWINEKWIETNKIFFYNP